MIRAVIAILSIVSLLSADWPAASVTRTAVSAALSAMAASGSEGDTVTIPPGVDTATYTTRIDVTVGFGFTLRGAGTNAAGSDYTRLDIKVPGDYGFDFRLSNTNAKVRVTGITFVATNCFAALNFGNANGDSLIAYKWSTYEVDHCLFDANSFRAIVANTPCYGVIHNNWFTGNGNPTGVSIFGYGGSNAFSKAIVFGATNYVYVENNDFWWPVTSGGANGAIDSYNGAQWVARTNRLHNTNLGNHGTDSGGSALRSTLGWEVYWNSFYNTNVSTALEFRGGTGLIYNNVGVGVNSTMDVVIKVYRGTGTNVYPIGVGNTYGCCDPFGGIYATNQWDGGGLAIGYPGLDQPGRTGPTSYGLTNTTQDLLPIHIWNNTYNGVTSSAVVGNDAVNTGVVNGFDLSRIPRPGLLIVAERDWTVAPYSYTPLTYPHPLTSAFVPVGTVGRLDIAGRVVILGQ